MNTQLIPGKLYYVKFRNPPNVVKTLVMFLNNNSDIVYNFLIIRKNIVFFSTLRKYDLNFYDFEQTSK